MRNHFTDENWLDYVRGLSPAPKAIIIKQHLEKGCQICHQSFQLWRTVAETARSEIPHEVPEHLVLAIQAAYIAWSRRHLFPRRARMALLIFDSWLKPLPAGVRNDSPLPRRIIERAGPWLIDLRFEPAAGKRMFLMGQVLRSGKHGEARVNLPILLMSPDALLMETSANQFGEFQLQFDQANGLRIYIDVPRQRPIGILLPDLDNHSAARETAID